MVIVVLGILNVHVLVLHVVSVVAIIIVYGSSLRLHVVLLQAVLYESSKPSQSVNWGRRLA
jgi:hypothetical protein